MKVKEYLENEIDESRFGIYGHKKNPLWLKWRERIFSAKSDKELTKILKELEKFYRDKKIGMTEFMDLVDKVDNHKQKLGLRGK